MEKIILRTFSITSAIMFILLLIPVDWEIPGFIELLIIPIGMAWILSFLGFLIWIDLIRDYYRNKQDDKSKMIMTLTFPIWVFGELLAMWGAYQMAKSIRNWMRKKD